MLNITEGLWTTNIFGTEENVGKKKYNKEITYDLGTQSMLLNLYMKISAMTRGFFQHLYLLPKLSFPPIASKLLFGYQLLICEFVGPCFRGVGQKNIPSMESGSKRTPTSPWSREFFSFFYRFKQYWMYNKIFSIIYTNIEVIAPNSFYKTICILINSWTVFPNSPGVD